MNTVSEMWYEGDDLHVIDDRERHLVFSNCYPVATDEALTDDPGTGTVNFRYCSK